jgi:hypothetical protein
VYDKNRNFVDETVIDSRPSCLGATNPDGSPNTQPLMKIEFTGHACTASSTNEGNQLHFFLREIKANRVPHYAGLSGFLDEHYAAAPVRDSGRFADTMRRADPGCGFLPKRLRGAKQPANAHTSVGMTDQFYIDPDRQTDADGDGDADDSDKYINSTSPASGEGTTPYGNYQGAGVFASENHLLEVSSTAVTHGGIVRAILPRGIPVKQHDYMTASDVNVACGRQRVARWIYIDANPNPSGTNDQHVYGWYPYPEPDGARSC